MLGEDHPVTLLTASNLRNMDPPPPTIQMPAPGDLVRTTGLQGMAVLNGVRGTVLPRHKWKEGRVAVRLETAPPKAYLLRPENLEKAEEGVGKETLQ